MAAPKIQLKRGPAATMPTLSDGEPVFTTDTHCLYVGQGGTAYQIGGLVDHEHSLGDISGLSAAANQVVFIGSDGIATSRLGLKYDATNKGLFLGTYRGTEAVPTNSEVNDGCFIALTAKKGSSDMHLAKLQAYVEDLSGGWPEGRVEFEIAVGDSTAVGLWGGTPEQFNHYLPVVFDDTTLWATPRPGAIEFDGDYHYFTDGEGNRGAILTGAVTESMLDLSDVTTADVSINEHGFCPKAPNDTAKYLRGDGAWATVSSTGSLDINGLTATDVALDDSLPEYDLSATANKKLSVDRLLGYADPSICQGRLTLESGVPVSVTDQSAKTSLYFSPYNGNRVALYDGTRWVLKTFQELTLLLTGVISGKNYDVFISDVGTGTTYVNDTFTGTDGTALTSHTPDTGGAWTSSAGTAQISGNTCVANTFLFLGQNPYYSVSYQEIGQTSYKITAKITLQGSVGQSAGVVFRLSGTYDFLLAHLYYNTSGSGLYIQKIISGGAIATVASAAATWTTGTEYTLVVEVNSVWVRATVENTTCSASNSQLGSSTKAGVVFYTADNTARATTIDNFKVEQLNTGVQLELSDAWTSDTVRSTAITTQDAIYVRSGATTNRYLGTIRASANDQCSDTLTKRFVWNQHNRLSRPVVVTEATDSWTYNSSTWRSWNNSTANRFQLVAGVAENTLKLSAIGNTLFGGGGTYGYGLIGIGIDSTSTNDATLKMEASANTGYLFANPASHLVTIPAIGFHYYQITERTANSTTITFYGDAGAASRDQSGMVGEWFC
jgi:hypothetical protein